MTRALFSAQRQPQWESSVPQEGRVPRSPELRLPSSAGPPPSGYQLSALASKCMLLVLPPPKPHVQNRASNLGLFPVHQAHPLPGRTHHPPSHPSWKQPVKCDSPAPSDSGPALQWFLLYSLIVSLLSSVPTLPSPTHTSRSSALLFRTRLIGRFLSARPRARHWGCFLRSPCSPGAFHT